MRRCFRTLVFLFPLLPLVPAPARGQSRSCDLSKVPGVVWWGTDTVMTFSRFAAYAAPIFWFSPDEPLLQERTGADIREPEPLPGGDSAMSPVVYYQLEAVMSRQGTRGAAAFAFDSVNRANSTINLRHTATVILTFFNYYPSEEGLGAHPHDIEPVEMRIVVGSSDGADVKRFAGAGCRPGRHVIVVTRTSGKAHGLVWFWNVLQTDAYTVFPMTMLVEEGKHALATDKNGDGYFTKGYDVNVRVNDAWGVRDIMRTGMLFSGGYESYMTKVRRPSDRVLPPLPEDSPLRAPLARRTARQALAVYELRPFPTLAVADSDPKLAKLMRDKVRGAPEAGTINDRKDLGRFIDEGAALKSLSIAYRYDGGNGVSFVFPFFVVKHLNDPMTGGYIVQRVYLRGKKPQDLGWMALYTPSASRWIDTYISAGGEREAVDTGGGGVKRTWHFVFETGLKFRVNIEETPLKFLGHLTPYWGVRMGLQNRGAFDVTRLRYVLEVGAGSF